MHPRGADEETGCEHEVINFLILRIIYFALIEKCYTKALVHVSSTYCHVDKPTVEEKMYPKEFNWKEMIRLANEMDDNVLRALTSK